MTDHHSDQLDKQKSRGLCQEKGGTVLQNSEKNELSPSISSEKDFKLKIRFIMSHRTQKFYLDVIHRHKR